MYSFYATSEAGKTCFRQDHAVNKSRTLSCFPPALKRPTRFRLMLVFLTAILLQVSITNAQNVNLSFKGATISDVLKQIKKQSGYGFVIPKDLASKARPVDVQISNMPLQDALKIIFRDQQLTWQINNKLIIIREKEAASSPKSNDAVQPIDVSGAVTDTTGLPIAGATIRAKNTSKFAISDYLGHFILTGIEPGTALSISSIGFKPVEVAVTGAEIRIVLKTDISQLKDITVTYNTGFATLSKERATGSFGKPDMEIFSKRAGTTDVIARLDGQIAGMTVGTGILSNASNNNNNGTTTRRSVIRGLSSIQLNTDPLYVVNGVIVPDFGALNVDDIEDITVLKDAAAAAIWGARAANGVVVITTKSGNKNPKPVVSYSGFVSYTPRPDLSYGNYMNSREYIQFAREIFDPVLYPYSSTTGYAPHEKIMYDQYLGRISATEANRRLDSLSAIDNLGQIQDIFFQPAITTNHTVSVSGGNNVYSFYGSFGYTGIQSQTLGNTNNSYKLNLSQSISPNKNIRLTINASMINTVLTNKNWPGVSSNFVPYQLFRDAAGNNLKINYLTGYSDSLRNDYTAKSRINLDYSPLDEVDLVDRKNNNINLNVSANLQVNIWKGLRFSGTYGYLLVPGTVMQYNDAQTLQERKTALSLTVAPTAGSTPQYNYPVTGGTMRNGTNKQRNFTIRNQLVYDAALRQGRDHLTLQAGNDIQEDYNFRNSNMVMGYDKKLGTYTVMDLARLRNGVFGTVTGFGLLFNFPYELSENKSRFLSYFGMGSYSFDGKYFIDASIRQDYSSQFGKALSSQNKPSWSLGGKWNLTREKMLSDVKWLNSLNLRSTFGMTGNSPYAGSGAYSPREDIFSAISSSTQYNVAGESLTLSGVANLNLSWEVTRVINLGIDFSMFNARLSGSVEAYHKNTTDLLGTIPLNPWSGRSAIIGNTGQLVNKGIEVTLRSENIRTKDLNWSTTLVLGRNQNKLVSYNSKNFSDFGVGDLMSSATIIVGQSINAMYAYRYGGLDNLGDPRVIKADGTLVKKYADVAAKDLVFVGNATPKLNGGFSNRIAYKGLALTANAVYSLGGVMRKDANILYNGRLQVSGFYGSNYQNYEMDRWKKPGDEAFTNIPSYVAGSVSNTRRFTEFYPMSDINIVSASYIKLRDISLAYDLPVNQLHFVKISKASVFAQASNFMIWHANKEGIDPEYPRTINPNTPGHTYSFGVNFTL